MKTFRAAVEEIAGTVGYTAYSAYRLQSATVAYKDALKEYALGLATALDEIAAEANPPPALAGELSESRHAGRETYVGAWGRVLALRDGEFGASPLKTTLGPSGSQPCGASPECDRASLPARSAPRGGP